MRTLKAMEFANDRNAKVIAITDWHPFPMNLYSSCNLLARSDMVSVVDSLVAPFKRDQCAGSGIVPEMSGAGA